MVYFYCLHSCNYHIIYCFLIHFPLMQNDLPTKCIFLDFQSINLGSPMKDIAQLIFCSANKHCLDNVSLLLESVYYRTFKDQVNAMGSDCEELYSLEKMWLDWKNMCKFGLVFSMAVLRLIYRQNEKLDNSNNQKTSDTLEAYSKMELSIDHLINKRVQRIILYLHKNSLLWE